MLIRVLTSVALLLKRSDRELELRKVGCKTQLLILNDCLGAQTDTTVSKAVPIGDVLRRDRKT